LFDGEFALLAEDGGYFDDATKDVAYLVNGKFWVNNHAHVLKTKGRMPTNFLVYALNSIDWMPYVGGSTRPKLNQEAMRRAEVTLPPLPEQHRIVVKLEEMFGRLDACRKRLEQIPSLLKQFRQSILTAACSGRLTSRWRLTASITEGADDLLRKVSATRAQANSRKTNLGLASQTASADGFLEIPDSWRWSLLDNLCDSSKGISYGVIKLGDDVEGGVPCLRTSNVRPLRIDVEGVKCISPNLSNEYKRTILEGREILVNVRGTLGGVAVVPQEMQGWNVSREVSVVPILPIFDSEFFALWIATDRSQKWLTRVAKGVAYTGINLEDLRQLPVAVPPLVEQQEIVRRVNALFRVADEVEDHYRKAYKQLDKLPQSILARAFRGELVPQDPDDEPASVLLERIRAEKAETGKPEKKIKRPAAAKSKTAAGRSTLF
jgi:type I restriction enzyme S subunit